MACAGRSSRKSSLSGPRRRVRGWAAQEAPVQPEILAERASAPELFLDPEGRPTLLFVDGSHAPERLGALQRDHDGLWKRVATNLKGVDPNVVRLDDGSYRAYVKAGLDGSADVYASDDGLNWVTQEGARIAAASVPAAIADGDERVLLYCVQPPWEPGKPETVACAVSTDSFIFRPEPSFRIEGLRTLKAVDPSIVRDEEGSFRLYYLASDDPGDPARGLNPHAIHLAISEDGVRFREIGPVFEYPDLVEPDVFRFRGRWWLFVFAAGRTIIAQSEDGFRFEYLTTLPLPGWGTTAPVLPPDGRLRRYAFDQRTPTGSVVQSFVSEDGLEWMPEPGVRLQARPDEQLTDPYVIRRRGGYRMYFKTMRPPQVRPPGQSGAGCRWRPSPLRGGQSVLD